MQASSTRSCTVSGASCSYRMSARLVPASWSRQRHAHVVYAKERTTGNETLDNALGVARSVVETASDLVPESVPRPVAKGGVAVAGGIIAFWLLQKVVSTVLTLVLLGGAAYLYFRSSSSDSDSGGSSGGGSSSSGGRGDDLDDPLTDARRIMDKYK